MLKHLCILITLLIKEVLVYRDSKITSTIAELDTSICDAIRHPVRGGAKHLLQDVKFFNSLFRKVKKTCLSTKEQELHGKKHVLAEIVLRSHPHFLTIKLDESMLVDEGKWESDDLESLKRLFEETERIKSKLERIIGKAE